MPGVGVPLRLRDEEDMEQGGDGGTGEGVGRESFAAKGPGEDDLEIVAVDAPAEDGDGEGGAGSEGEGGEGEGAPGSLAEEVKEEDPGEDLGHDGEADKDAGEAGAATLPGEAGQDDHGEQEEVELAVEQVAVEGKAEDGEEDDAAEGLTGERAESQGDGDEQEELEDEPEVFGLERRKRGEGVDEEGGEGGDGCEGDDRLIDLTVILFALEPAPVVGLGGVEVLVGELGGEIVVGEVGVERAPGAGHGVAKEEGGEDGEEGPLEEALKTCGGHGLEAVFCRAVEGMAGCGRGTLAQAGELEHDMPDEGGIVVQVTLPEVAGILDEAVEPLQARAFDPLGAVLDTAGVEVEGGTDSEHESGVEAGDHAVHEELLFGRADADPDDVGFELGDGGDEVVFFRE